MINYIKESFASLRVGRYLKIDFDNPTTKAWIFRNIDGYGVAIPFEYEEIYEHFTNVILKSEKMKLDGEIIPVLTLTCDIELLRNEFAVIASQFIEPGKENYNRTEILNNPRDWWNKWSTLIGNAFVEKKAYDIIAELLSYEYLYDNNENPTWRGPLGGSQDITTTNGYVEVKSTLRKYGAVISVNSQFQLNSESKENRLFFVRLERSTNGESIEDIYKRLLYKGVDNKTLEDNLNKAGIHRGSTLWKEKYEILEKRQYIINSSFPVITPDSFLDGKIPTGILKIVYDIDLDSMHYEVW